jgi:hypothetical protein
LSNLVDFSDFVFLAQGPLFGIASECMLKVTESSSSYAQVFHSLEFRHGPKSIASPRHADYISHVGDLLRGGTQITRGNEGSRRGHRYDGDRKSSWIAAPGVLLTFAIGTWPFVAPEQFARPAAYRDLGPAVWRLLWTQERP